MGMGMLFAGALAGGAKGMESILADQSRREEKELEWQRAATMKRQELLDAMELKEQYARRSEQESAMAYETAAQGATKAGDDRRFAKFKQDVGQTDATDEQLREIFNQSYNNKVSTQEAGGDRYVEPESRYQADVLAEMRRGGAPGELIKDQRRTYDAQVKAEQEAARLAAKERDAKALQDFRDRQLMQQNEIATARMENVLQRQELANQGKGAGGIDQSQKLSVLKDVKARAEASMPDLKDFRGSKQKYDAAMEQWRKTEDGKISAEASSRILSLLGGSGGPQPGAAQPSAAPKAKPITKAEYDALPSGATFVAPDGTTRKKP